MEGTWVRKGQGYGRDMIMQLWRVHGFGGDNGMEGTSIWRGQGYGRDMGKEGTWVWRGHAYLHETIIVCTNVSVCKK